MKAILTLLCITLTVLSLSTAAVSQTPSGTPLASPTAVPTPKPDIRNLAPTVGTGSGAGGATGLFTIFDGQVLQPGEFSVSFGFSNYDRDPGDADISEVPASLHMGIGANAEFFLSLNAYRRIRIHNPRNLSSFYLPNSQLLIGGILQSGGAIVLAPINNAGIGGAVFRPPGIQPFVQFPYVGGSAGNYFPGFTFTLGTPSGGSFHPFGTASAFPGIGSPFGSILPGIVLSTTTQPVPPIILPNTFTLAPTYLPDFPFVNRTSGNTALNSLTVGIKWRLTKPERAFGFGFVPFYRGYLDDADDARGFNQLQRGAGPGAGIGDFGLVMFADGRLSRHVNLSANLGFILNSNPRSEAFGFDATLLDRPNEFVAGVGFDFPINKYVQPVFELRSTQYVGGRTPNAFENSPVEILGGVRFFTKTFEKGIFEGFQLGFSAAYRRHLNQQRSGSFSSALPTGFIPSDDPNGFMFQFWIGRRNPPPQIVDPGDTRLGVKIMADLDIKHRTLPCPPGSTVRTNSQANCVAVKDLRIPITIWLTDIRKEELTTDYNIIWLTNNLGSITDVKKDGEKYTAIWNLNEVEDAGTYRLTLTFETKSGQKAKDSEGNELISSIEVPINVCPDCITCPSINVTSSPEPVEEGSDVTFSTNVSGGTRLSELTYLWEVSEGEIKSGADSSTITVRTAKLGGKTITATVTVGGFDSSCPTKAQGMATVLPPSAECRLFDSYGPIKYNDEKARLDNFAIELQREPDAKGYLIAYRGHTDPDIGNIGTEKNIVVGDVCASYRLERARAYLVNDRKIAQERFILIDGGSRRQSSVQLWLCPLNRKPVSTPESVPETQKACITKGMPVSKRRNARRSRSKKIPARSRKKSRSHVAPLVLRERH